MLELWGGAHPNSESGMEVAVFTGTSSSISNMEAVVWLKVYSLDALSIPLKLTPFFSAAFRFSKSFWPANEVGVMPIRVDSFLLSGKVKLYDYYHSNTNTTRVYLSYRCTLINFTGTSSSESSAL